MVEGREAPGIVLAQSVALAVDEDRQRTAVFSIRS
jgi:hypothetical protein